MTESTIIAPEFFVGREAELRQLERALTSTINSKRPRFILIQGDVGIGKTVLVESFLASIPAQERTALIGQGRCSLETERNGLIPFSQVLGGLAERGTQMHLIAGSMWEFVKDVAPAWLNLVTYGLAEPVFKTVEAGVKAATQSKFAEENVFTQFTNAIARLAERKPIVIFIDDLHWADESSLRLLFHLQRNLTSGAVLFLCTYRPQITFGTGENTQIFNEISANLIRSGASEIEIQEGIDVQSYVSQRYPRNTFDADFIERIQTATEGHPLFIDQLFDLWESTGVICSSPGSDHQPFWCIACSGDVRIDIPPALTKVLGQRIRIMENSLRDILTYAAIEGESFTAQVVAGVRQLDELTVFNDLEALEHEHHLIRQKESRPAGAGGLDFYRFVQRFIREYVYEQPSAGKRRILHHQVGECLESLYAKRDLREIASQLAWHFGEAQEPWKAAHYALLAAEREQERYALVEGEKWCEFGLKQLQGSTPDIQMMALQLDLFEKSALGLFNSGKYPQAEQRYKSALALAREISTDVERIASLCAQLASLLESEGRSDEVMPMVDQGLHILAQSGAPLGEASVALQWLQSYMLGRFGNAPMGIQALRELQQKASDLPPTPTLERLLIRILNSLALMLDDLGQYREVLSLRKQGLILAERAGDQLYSGNLWLSMTYTYIEMSLLDEAMDCINKGRAIAQRTGDTDNIFFAKALEAQVDLALGKPQDAMEKLVTAIGDAESRNSLWWLPHLHTDLALAYLALSETDKASEMAKRGVKEALQQNHRYEMGLAFDALGQVEAAQHKLEAAADHFGQAIEIHQAAGHRLDVARARRRLAQVYHEQGHSQEARDLLTSSLAAFQELELAHEVDETERLLRKLSES